MHGLGLCLFPLLTREEGLAVQTEGSGPEVSGYALPRRKRESKIQLEVMKLYNLEAVPICCRSWHLGDIISTLYMNEQVNITVDRPRSQPGRCAIDSTSGTP